MYSARRKNLGGLLFSLYINEIYYSQPHIRCIPETPGFAFSRRASPFFHFHQLEKRLRSQSPSLAHSLVHPSILRSFLLFTRLFGTDQRAYFTLGRSRAKRAIILRSKELQCLFRMLRASTNMPLATCFLTV